MARRYRRRFKKSTKGTRRGRRGYRKAYKGTTKILTVKENVVTTSAITDTFYTGCNSNFNASGGFHLSDIGQYTQYMALYDQFRLAKVQMKFIFDKNDAVMGSSSTSIIPNLISVVDKDDGTPLTTSIQPWANYASFKMSRLDKVVKRTAYPQAALGVYKGVFSASGEASRKQWLDTNNYDIELYGLKWGVIGTMAGGTGGNLLGQLTVIYSYTFQFKSGK
nr:MAG: capsid protein [Cressdnaviricota sp.]